MQRCPAAAAPRQRHPADRIPPLAAQTLEWMALPPSTMRHRRCSTSAIVVAREARLRVAALATLHRNDAIHTSCHWFSRQSNARLLAG
jgi:2-methylcitrate dehydratase PrpD